MEEHTTLVTLFDELDIAERVALLTEHIMRLEALVKEMHCRVALGASLDWHRKPNSIGWEDTSSPSDRGRAGKSEVS